MLRCPTAKTLRAVDVAQKRRWVVSRRGSPSVCCIDEVPFLQKEP